MNYPLKLSLFFVLISINNVLFCQKTYTIPKEYKILKDYNNKDIRIDADFDADGTNDVALVCVDKNDYRNVYVYLSSQYFTKGIYSWFPTEQEYFDFEYKNGTLHINGSAGKFEEKINLKYYSDLEGMRLIRYEYGYVGSLNDSPWSTVVDFLSTQYTEDIAKKKTSFNVITLSNIEQFLDYFGSNGW
jgi:hypothetical protein